MSEAHSRPKSKGAYYFDFAEHQFLGDQVTVAPYKKGDPVIYIDGKNPHDGDKAKDDRVALTYGAVSALAGDYYATENPISDGDSPKKRSELFLKACGTLFDNKDDQPEDVRKILKIVFDERVALGNDLNHETHSLSAWYAGQNPIVPFAQAQIATMGRKGLPSFISLLLNNFDHFGKDARLAYEAGHAAAIAFAAEGGKEPNLSRRHEQLGKAYAMNAFADHFLEDLFSAGHLRTPRRALHGQAELVGPLLEAWNPLKLKTWYETFGEVANAVLNAIPSADFCSFCMHNEENKKGLKVFSEAGHEWTCYGDQHLLDDKNMENLIYCQAAINQSATEVYAAWQTGIEIESEQFRAWQLIPHPKDDNIKPMFRLEGSILLQRKELFDTECEEYEQVESESLGGAALELGKALVWGD